RCFRYPEREVRGGGAEREGGMKRAPFRGLGAILFKEFIIVWRDPMTLFFMFFPPLVEMIAFGYALDTDVKHMALVILNEERTVESRQFVDRFVNTETFRVVGEVQSIEEMSSQIRKGRAYAGLQIPPKFTQNVRTGYPAQVQLLVDGSNSTTALQALNTALSVEPLGPYAGQARALSLHRHDDGDDSVFDHALPLRRPDRWKRSGDDVRHARLRVRIAQSRIARGDKGRKSDASTANVDGLHVAE